jgi:hypothetical protein
MMQQLKSDDRKTEIICSPTVVKKRVVKLLYEWANTHGKCVRQRTVRQETTSYKCGTLPLNMYVSTSIKARCLEEGCMWAQGNMMNLM